MLCSYVLLVVNAAEGTGQQVGLSVVERMDGLGVEHSLSLLWVHGILYLISVSILIFIIKC